VEEQCAKQNAYRKQPLAAASWAVTDYANYRPMSRRKSDKSGSSKVAPEHKVNLRELAEHLGLSVATVSMVMNRSPAAKSIPHHTQSRVRAAARELNYRPNVMARMLRQQRSFTIGVIVPEISEGYAALVLSGIEDHLLQEGYFYFVVSHRHRTDLIEEYPVLLQQRAVEGLILVDTPMRRGVSLPVVAVSGHKHVAGVTNISLNHSRAARLALEHLHGLGHRKIALIKGQAFSSDTEVRWKAVRAAAQEIRLSVDEKLTVQLESESPTPQPGYEMTCQLLKSGAQFTAMFAFNDISALGAIRALREAGRRVPEDVSVIGFDDIQSAAYQNPGLTTIRQPLRQMGMTAAETLVGRINAPKTAEYPKNIVSEPELIVRGSTAVAI
jgi:DNA-binding LacI/PurR family transcriptional regulator